MAVPIPVIAGVAVVVLIIILIIIFTILRKRKQAALEENSSTKGKYQKLESGEHENEGALAEGNENENGGKGKKKKKRKKGGKKGKNKRKESQDLEAGLEEGTGLDDSSVFTDDLAVPLISRLQFSVSYSPTSRQLLLTIHRGENFGIGSTTNFEVRVTLLPSKRQKFKTKSQPSGNPDFNEIFMFDEVFPGNLELATLRSRVYKLNGRQRKLIGELQVNLKTDLGLDTGDVNLLWRELTPATDIADDISDTLFVTDPETILAAPKETVPMLLISLQYKSITGKLAVEIIKARHMKTLNVQKAPEAFVEVSLLNANGGEITNAKTGVSKGSFHPTFGETFYFTAIEFELAGLTLVFSVSCKPKFRKKELVGWFGIGRESTGEREQLHWDEMIDARGEPIRGWYVLSQD